jgi:hypothetical protein
MTRADLAAYPSLLESKVNDGVIMSKRFVMLALLGLLAAGCNKSANQGGGADTSGSATGREVSSGHGKIYDRGGEPGNTQPQPGAQGTGDVNHPNPDRIGTGSRPGTNSLHGAGAI